jgi:hypothetical protein
MNNLYIFFFLFIGRIHSLYEGEKIYKKATIYYINSKYEIIYDKIDKINGIACGIFEDNLSKIGWGILKIFTNSKFENEKQMYAAGYLEGILTSNRIYENYQNIYHLFFHSQPPSNKLYNFLDIQNKWVRLNINKNNSNFYWKTISLIMAQFDGLIEGYNQYSDKKLSVFSFQMLNGVGDFLDLLPALDKHIRPNWDKMSPNEIKRKISLKNHCSGLIKILPDFSDIFIGHSSWFSYAAMNRIYKHYYFNLVEPFIASKKISFSSYPGFLVSLDVV